MNEERAIDRDAVLRTADYAKRRRTKQLVVISAISAYWPQSSPLALKHYSKMKREADDYVQASGVPHVILRPGPLSDEIGRGTIALSIQRSADAALVSRDDVARVTVECIKRDIRNEVIGFVGGDVPIDDVLDAIQTAPISR